MLSAWIGRATRVVTAAEKGLTLREVKQCDEAVPVASDSEQTFMTPGSSLVLRVGMYKLIEGKEGRLVLHRIKR